jgi:hypothetical protein
MVSLQEDDPFLPPSTYTAESLEGAGNRFSNVRMKVSIETLHEGHHLSLA